MQGNATDIFTAIGYAQGVLAVNEDYAKVMSFIEINTIGRIFGLNHPDGTHTISKLIDETKTEADGETKVIPTTTSQVKRWPFYAHYNPFDMLMHFLSQDVINQANSQARYPGGLHFFYDESKIKKLKYSFHTDRYSPIYGLNVINHLLFESEVLKAFFPDPDNGTYGNKKLQNQRSHLSSQIRRGYNLFEQGGYVF